MFIPSSYAAMATLSWSVVQLPFFLTLVCLLVASGLSRRRGTASGAGENPLEVAAVPT
jgi:hypothetical protein